MPSLYIVNTLPILKLQFPPNAFIVNLKIPRASSYSALDHLGKPDIHQYSDGKLELIQKDISIKNPVIADLIKKFTQEHGDKPESSRETTVDPTDELYDAFQKAFFGEEVERDDQHIFVKTHEVLTNRHNEDVDYLVGASYEASNPPSFDESSSHGLSLKLPHPTTTQLSRAFSPVNEHHFFARTPSTSPTTWLERALRCVYCSALPHVDHAALNTLFIVQPNILDPNSLEIYFHHKPEQDESSKFYKLSLDHLKKGAFCDAARQQFGINLHTLSKPVSPLSIVDDLEKTKPNTPFYFPQSGVRLISLYKQLLEPYLTQSEYGKFKSLEEGAPEKLKDLVAELAVEDLPFSLAFT